MRYKGKPVKTCNNLIVPALAAAAVLALGGTAFAQTNSLVYEGPDGRLAYGTYANQGQSNAVNTIPDFSTAGYKGGGVPIPFVPAAVTVSAPTGGDDTALIQDAIDTVAGMPVQANGFRGAVLIKAGNYQVGSTISINTGGIVIRGEGQQATGGTKITMTATVQDNLFEVAGGGGLAEVANTRQTITDAYVPVGATSFTVVDASGFSAGDSIRTQHKMNDQWIIDIGMDSISGGDPLVYDWTAASYQLYHERTVTGVAGNTVYVDAPFMQAVEDQYGGGDIFKYTSGQISNIGFESLRLESTYLSDTDEEHGWRAILLRNVRDGWVRQVTSRYFGYSTVSILATCHYITVEDCANLDPKSITTGGRKYSFEIDDSAYLLLQRLYARGGRHDFVSGSLTPGPNVFVDSLAEVTYSDAGPHHRYATGQLYDNIKAGEINVQNRLDSGSGHGWAGAQTLFWNSEAAGMICDAPHAAMNWSIGCVATHNQGYWVPGEPDGIWESHNTPITTPRSLYYRQLSERLDRNAARNVTLPSQEAGTIWADLSSWAGDGLFGSSVIAWSSASAIMDPTNTVDLTGSIRNLQMLENGATSTWSKVSGAGTVTFGNASQLATTASFSTTGVYVVRLTAGDGTTTAAYDIMITYGDVSPAVSATGATSSSSTTATLQGELLAGDPADVYFVWDTQDQGSNFNAWASSSLLPSQPAGGVSNTVSGLFHGPQYTYRVFASNAFGVGWSSPVNVTTPAPDSGYDLLEDFEARILDAAIVGQGDWLGDGSSPDEFSVKVDPDDTDNQVLWFNQGAGKEVSLNSPGLRIAEGTTGTFFFRMRGLCVETNLVMRIRPELCDRTNPSSLTHVGPETEFVDNGAGSPKYTDTANLQNSQWYRVWIVADNATDTFDSYLLPEGGSQFQASNGRAFRNPIATDLVSFMLLTLSGGSNGDAWFDDFYIAPGQDLHTIDPLAPPVTLAITNTAAANVTAGSADLACLLTAVDSVFTVRAYWSTSNNTDAAAWLADSSAASMEVGVYTNVTDLAVTGAVSPLNAGTTYYYTLMATNALTTLWADANVSFTTEAMTYSVTYDGNGHTGGTVPADANSYTEGATVTVLGNTGNLVQSGYSFSGWNTQADGSGTAYAADATFSMPGSNVTLYAQWTKAIIPFTEDFEALTLADLNGQHGWAASNAVVQTNVVFEGAQAAAITSETGFFEQSFAGSETNVWTDLQLQPVFFDGDFDPATSDCTSIVYFNTNGNPVVFDHTNAVVVSGVQVATGEWVRVSVHSDYVAQTWDLYINEAQVKSDLGFYNAAVTHYTSLRIQGAGSLSVPVDAIGIDLQSPFEPLLYYTLTVNSAHGTPTPAGTNNFASGTTVLFAMPDSPLISPSNTMYEATGWVSTGSLTSAAGTNGSFTITNDTTMTWQWSTNYWIELNVATE